MELLIVIAILCAVGVLAIRFGYDSRSLPRSPEEQAALDGMAWDAPPTRSPDWRRIVSTVPAP